MSRLAAKFAEFKTSKHKALIPFITAGDPNPQFTVPMMHTMVAAGADIIELGVPFSDPMADGPVIQRASERALEHKMNLRCTLAIVHKFRAKNQTTPVVLMGYANPVEAMGYEVFARAAKHAGVDGVLTVDLPPEEAQECAGLLNAQAIDQIFLIAPNTSPERIKKINSIGSGFVYYVSVKGITGTNHLDTSDVQRKLIDIRANTKLPIGIGFGIKEAKTAKIIAGFGDAVVVGSALISQIEANLSAPDLAKQNIIKLLKSMRLAMNNQD